MSNSRAKRLFQCFADLLPVAKDYLQAFPTNASRRHVCQWHQILYGQGIRETANEGVLARAFSVVAAFAQQNNRQIVLPIAWEKITETSLETKTTGIAQLFRARSSSMTNLIKTAHQKVLA